MSSIPPFKRPAGRVQSIEALRGVSALFVLGFHFFGYLNGVYAQSDIGSLLFLGGYVGVDLFFMISGFVMVFVTREISEARFVPFLLKRFFRVWPMTWLATLLFYFARGGKFTELFANKPAWADYFFTASYLPIAWTIRFELVFYLIFALSFLASYRYRTLVCSAIIIAAVLGLPYAYGVELTLHPDTATGRISPLTEALPLRSFVLVLGNPYSLEFIPGMMLGELYVKLSTSTRKPYDVPQYAVAIAMVIFASGFFSHFSAGYPPDRVVRALPYCIILMGTLLFAEVNGRLDVSPGWVRLGELTFSVYLYHLFVPHLFASLPSIGEFRGVPFFLIAVGTTLLLAWFMYYFVERHLIRLGRNAVDAVERKWPRFAAYPQRERVEPAAAVVSDAA